MSNISLKMVVLKTNRLAEVVAFYHSLGIAFHEEQHGTGPVHHAGQIAGAILEIYPLPDGVSAADTTTRLGFAVENLDATLQAIQAKPAQESEWGRRAVVRDPDGRAIELYQA
jgi:predicted enzyme related to lactoylglutathione lyase